MKKLVIGVSTVVIGLAATSEALAQAAAGARQAVRSATKTARPATSGAIRSGTGAVRQSGNAIRSEAAGSVSSATSAAGSTGSALRNQRQAQQEKAAQSSASKGQEKAVASKAADKSEVAPSCSVIQGGLNITAAIQTGVASADGSCQAQKEQKLSEADVRLISEMRLASAAALKASGEATDTVVEARAAGLEEKLVDDPAEQVLIKARGMDAAQADKNVDELQKQDSCMALGS